MDDVLKLTTQFVNDIDEIIKKNLKKEELDEIKKSDGREKNSPECCKKSSSIYFLYNDKEEIIYIGETGASVKHRLFTDGSGSHDKKGWISKVRKLRYYKNDEMDPNSRKTIERALIQKHNPKYNNDKNKTKT